MAFIEALCTLWPFACEHYSVAGGLLDVHRKAKDFVARQKAAGSSLVEIWGMARLIVDFPLRAAVLRRLSTRVSKNNVLHHALVCEAQLCE